MSSDEFIALSKLGRPDTERTGDMWLCRRLGIVRISTGHIRAGNARTKRSVLTGFHLYHWGKPSLRTKPADWRDYDANASSLLPSADRHEHWEYVGNIFERLPYEDIAAQITSCPD